MIGLKKWMSIELGKLVKAEWNYKDDDAERAQKLTANIRKNGQVENIIVRELDNGAYEVVNGNHRIDTFRELGTKKVVCFNMGRDVSLASAQRLAVETNETKFERDEMRLAEVLSNIVVEFDLDDLDTTMPFDEGELRDMVESIEALNSGGSSSPPDVEPRIDKAETLLKKWKVKTGQLWSLGEHRLLCGDASVEGDVDFLMDGCKADLMFTDPPYGVSYTGKTKDKMTIKNDNLSHDELLSICKKWFDCADSVTKGGAYWIATTPPGAEYGVFYNDWLARGIFKQGLVWVKDQFVLGHSEYHYQHEPILFGWKKGRRLKNKDRSKTSVWSFDRPRRSDVHPTVKPVELWRYGIENHSRRGNLVYEPFCGSGTSIVACEQLGWRCYALELDPKFVAVSLERYFEVTGETPSMARR